MNESFSSGHVSPAEGVVNGLHNTLVDIAELGHTPSPLAGENGWESTPVETSSQP